MTLSETIKEYRTEKGLSQRQFALKCGVSNANISMIENNLNPKTGQPLTPTLPMLKKIANGMNLSLDELLSKTEDFIVDISSPTPSPSLSLDAIEVAQLYDQLDAGDQGEVRGTIKTLLRAEKYERKNKEVG